MVIIKYISLDTRYNRVRTHQFVLLNHFHYGVKVSFPFYFYSSMHKNIFWHKKKPTSNSSLHEGLLLLIYEYFKAQCRSKTLAHVGGTSKDIRSSKFSSDLEEF